MTQEDKDFLKRVTTYAEKNCKDLDPKKTKSSVRLDKLMPVFEEIARENGQDVEDVFVRYMDLSMEADMTKVGKDTSDIFNIPDGEFGSGGLDLFHS